MTTAEMTKKARQQAVAAHVAVMEVLENEDFMAGVARGLADPAPGKTFEQINRERGF